MEVFFDKPWMVLKAIDSEAARRCDNTATAARAELHLRVPSEEVAQCEVLILKGHDVKPKKRCINTAT